jgi:hypothetical protein
MKISKSTEDQFESINKKQCKEFHQANISHIDVIFTDETIKKIPVLPIKPVSVKVKLYKNKPPCKYGERDSQGKCPPKPKSEKKPKNISEKKTSPIKKLPKCQKGTRRNKKTGNCE